MIDGQKFCDQPIENDKKPYENLKQQIHVCFSFLTK